MNPEAKGSTTWLEGLAWLDAHRAKALATVVILGALMAVILIWRELRQLSETKASAAVLMVEKPGFRSSATNRVSPQAFLDVAKAHPGTDGGGQAILFAAEAFFAEGQFAEAATQFQRFSKEYAGSPLLSSADLGLAACLEAQAKSNEALTAYQEVTTRYPGSPAAAWSAT